MRCYRPMIQILYATCIIGQQESVSVMTASLWPKKFAKICSQRELLQTASCKSYLSLMSNLILATLMRESEVLQLQTFLTLLCNLCLTGQTSFWVAATPRAIYVKSWNSVQHDLAKKASQTTVVFDCTCSIRVKDRCTQVNHESAALSAATRLKVTYTCRYASARVPSRAG